MKEYLKENIPNLELFKKEFPNLIFESLTPTIYNIIVPTDAEKDFSVLENILQPLFVPNVYGLNAEQQALQSAGISIFHKYPFGELRGNNVLIGFIDTGIEYTNSFFKYEDNTTRIAAIWDQTLEGTPPHGYNFGAQYLEDQINLALKSPDPYKIVPSKDEIGHGTFIAGVAAGYDRLATNGYIGAAPDATLAMVKLRPARDYLKEFYLIPKDTIAYQDNDIVAGIAYLLSLTIKLKKPLVLCLGLGNNFGGHNGSTLLERYLDQLSSYANLIILSSAGNEANTSHHYSGTLTAGGTQNIEINVAEKELGFFMQLWVNAPDKMSLSIRSPIGQSIDKVNVISEKEETFTFSLQPTKITITYYYPDINTGDEYIQVRVEKPIPGIWTFTIYGDYIVDGNFNIWLPRQGFIESSTRFLQPDPFITVCIPSTGSQYIVVGAYDYIDGSVYASSGRGPTRNNVIKPDIIAPGVNIVGPKIGGGYTTYIGTSSATAITAGAAALLLEWAVINRKLPQMNTKVAKAIFIRGATRQSNVKYPNPIEGYGKLNLQNSLSLI